MLSPAGRVRRTRLRVGAAAVILVAWIAALAGLVRRDVMRSDTERMTDLGMRVSPGNVFYAVEQGGQHIGYASTTIDTLVDSLVIRDEMIADVPVGRTVERTIMRSQILLSRGFALREFAVDVAANGAPARVSGRNEGDTSIAFIVETGAARPDTQRVRVSGPVLLPSLLPIATMLGGTPKVGRSTTFQTFDPGTLASKSVTMRVLAESLFVVDDSARKDPGTGRWVSAFRDTVRAWRLGAEDAPNIGGWVDAQGRVVESAGLPGMTLHRQAYELAFENWRLAARDSARTVASDIVTASTIAANVRAAPTSAAVLRARLLAPSLSGFALRGGRQTLVGDVVTVTHENAAAMTPSYTLPATGAHRTRFRAELGDEPGIEANAPSMVRQAVKIVGLERDPRVIAEKLNRWVFDSLQKVPTAGFPDAVAVLQSRRGDCNEHTQLYTALARTLGLPTRVAAGIVHVGGKFYYHAWPEVFLGDWVAVDPTFGQFPADVSHIRLMTGGLRQQGELYRLIGTLHVDVMESK